MKIAGIACDNYKIKKFKKELTKNGFTNFEIKPFVNETSVIQVKCEESQYAKVMAICRNVELHFKHSK